MNQDQIEIPVQRCLYRQSSLETRLSPAHLSEEELSGSDSEEESSPKVVNIILKQSPDFLSELRKVQEKQSSKGCTDDNKGDSNKPNVSDIYSVPNKSNVPNKINVPNKTDVPNETNLQNKPSISNKPDVPEKPNALDKSSEVMDNPPPKPIRNINAVQNKISRDESLDAEISKSFTKSVNVKEPKMATLRPKSPRPTPTKNDKEESIWDKLGTLGRKKRIKEVQEVEAEGKYAIDSPGSPANPAIPPEDYELEENEERSIIEPKSMLDPKLLELQQVLIEWINDELSKQRIIVQDLAEDLYDGQVLQKLLEVLTGDKLEGPEVTQSEEAQKQKLAVVLSHFNQVLGLQRASKKKWSVQAIHSKSIVPIMHLLVALARHFRPPVRLTEHVRVPMVVVQKINGQLIHRIVQETITSAYDDVGMRCERDAFDTLFDHAPDKLQVVKKSMVTFVNKHLNKINLEVSEIETQFHDGVYLTLLMGLLEGFFVPLHSFHLTPKEHEQKVHNVGFAFELMEEVDAKPKARPEDIVNFDLKSTLRVLYHLFTRYREIS